MPDVLAGLPPELVSHSYDHHELSRFAGKKLLMLGAGSSAVDTAVLAQRSRRRCHAAGARAVTSSYHAMPDPDAVSWLQAITHPSSGIGPGWRSFLCTNAPRLFRRLPEALRLRATKRHLGPAPGWFMRGKLHGAATYLGHDDRRRARLWQTRVLLTLARRRRHASRSLADHVIAATGYQARPAPPAVPGHRACATQIAHVEHTPRLSDHFETSVPGLYAMGILAANTSAR